MSLTTGALADHGRPLVVRMLLPALLLAGVLALVLRLAGNSLAQTGELTAVQRPVPSERVNTDLLVSGLQERVRLHPDDAEGYARLGSAYLQKARLTADPGYYSRAGGVFERALALQPNQTEALIGKGTLALALHQFREALALGEQAAGLAPASAPAQGIIADAHLELGEYPAAFAALQRMVDLRPDLASYARVSYARELTGDIPGAIAAMSAAVEAGGPGGENAAWARVQLGNLYRNYQGREGQERAEQMYRQALLSSPDYAPALAGLAQSAAARGDLKEAIVQAQRAATLLPLPEHVILLGDLLRRAGRSDEAAQQDALVRAMSRLAVSAGMDTDLETALFEADMGEQLAAAVAVARQGYERRPSVKGADTLAWALYRAGQTDEARPLMDRALALGSQDPLLQYHAGKIALAAGDVDGAVQHLRSALAANPLFSLRYADDARRTLAALSGGGQP